MGERQRCCGPRICSGLRAQHLTLRAQVAVDALGEEGGGGGAHLKPSRTSDMVRCSSSHSCPFQPISHGISCVPHEWFWGTRPGSGSFGMLAPRSMASKNLGRFRVLRLRFCTPDKDCNQWLPGMLPRQRRPRSIDRLRLTRPPALSSGGPICPDAVVFDYAPNAAPLEPAMLYLPTFCP